MPSYKPEHEAAMNKIMASQKDAEAGKMFGYPGYKVNGKMTIRLHEDGVLVKVGRPAAEKLIADGKGKQFEPLKDRPWRDWVLLTDNIESQSGLFKDAVELAKKAAK
jgi:hypothetical protein